MGCEAINGLLVLERGGDSFFIPVHKRRFWPILAEREIASPCAKATEDRVGRWTRRSLGEGGRNSRSANLGSKSPFIERNLLSNSWFVPEIRLKPRIAFFL
jgi:hypothetical protein